MSDLIDRFAADYHDYHAISPARRIDQMRALRDLEAFLAPAAIDGLQPGDLQRWLGDLHGRRGLHVNTVRKHLGFVRPFIRWMWQEHMIDAERLLRLRDVGPPRGATGQGKPRPYKRPELERMFAEIDEAYPWTRVGPHDKVERRAREDAPYWIDRWQRGQSNWSRVQPFAKRLQLDAIVALALHLGLRRDEVFRCGPQDAHPDNEYVVARGARKNRQAEERLRPVPWMSDEARETLRAWIDFRAVLEPDHDALWLSLHQNHRLKPMRHRQFEMLLREVGSGWEFHRLRHTAATHMLRAGVPLERVCVILGHSRLEQTRQYVDVDVDDLIRAVGRAQDGYTQAVGRGKAA
jgi:site-specific recombinase XerD